MRTIAVICICGWLSACAGMIPAPQSEQYATKLAAEPLLAKHAPYFRTQYAGTTKDEAYWAYRAIIEGEMLAVEYELALSGLAKGDSRKTIISNMKNAKKALVSHLANYSSVWSKAIHDNVHYKYSSVDFSTALAITQREYRRLGLFTKIDSMKEVARSTISQFDKQKYQKTLELYAVLSQLVALVEEPKGSSVTFSSTVNSLNSDFTKTLALAELEF